MNKKTSIFAALSLAGAIVIATALPASAAITAGSNPTTAAPGTPAALAFDVTTFGNGAHSFVFGATGTGTEPAVISVTSAEPINCTPATTTPPAASEIECVWDPGGSPLTQTITVSLAIPAAATGGETFAYTAGFFYEGGDEVTGSIAVSGAVVPPVDPAPGPAVPTAVPAGNAPAEATTPLWVFAAGGLGALVIVAGAASVVAARSRSQR